VAEESVCCNLKPERSAAVFKELTVRGQDLYSCELNCHGQVEVWVLDAVSHKRRRLITGGFLEGNQAHYVPRWLDSSLSISEYGLRIRYTSDENMTYNVKVKTSAAERKKMEEEDVASMDDDVDLKAVQTLLNKNRSLLI
jgi:hypothetical protein